MTSVRNFFIVLLQREHWWAEFWSGVVAVGWAMLNFFSSQDLSLLGSYRLLIAIQPELFWEGIATVLGIAQIAFLAADLRWPRLVAAAGCAWFYSVLAASIVFGAENLTPTWPLIVGYVGINLFALGRLVANLR